MNESTSGKLYLDLGGALAALGLLFAVYQLRKPRWDVVLQINPWFRRNLFWIPAFVGLAVMLVAVLVDKFQPCCLPIWLPTWLRDTLPYQAVAYFGFIASPFLLLRIAANPCNLFTKQNAARFYEILAQNIATGDNQKIDASLMILLANFYNICKSASQEKDSKTRYYARAILDVILSDSAIVKILTTRNLIALQHVFKLAETFGLKQSYSSIWIPALVKNLYADSNSFLYKQYRADGLALTMNIYETIFASEAILENFNLFYFPSLDYAVRQKIGVDGIGVFIEALSFSIKTYLTSGNVPAKHINRGLEFLSDTFGEHCMQISRVHKGEETIYPPTPSWEILQKITHFIGNDIIFLVERNDWNRTVLQRENSAADDNDFLSQVSISSGIAEIVCRAFPQLAQIGKTTDNFLTYHAIVELLDGMISENRAFSEGYRQRFERGIWMRIRLNIVKRHYPATLRTYLEFLGLHLLSNPENQRTWIQSETERVRRVLYVDLKPLFEN